MSNTLHVTVESPTAFDETVTAAIERRAERAGGTPAPSVRGHTVTFPSEELLAETFTQATLSLLRTITDDEPASIRETARLVGRDVKNVHQELTHLEAMGVLEFEHDGQARRPRFPYDELVISVPFPTNRDDRSAPVSQ